MTEQVLEDAGVRVDHPESDTYEVRTEQNSEFDYTVPADFSSAGTS
jgi:5-enolpyruvylshikimate-3-phosphate synthase